MSDTTTRTARRQAAPGRGSHPRPQQVRSEEAPPYAGHRFVQREGTAVTTRHTDEDLYQAARATYGDCGPSGDDADLCIDREAEPTRTEQGAWVRAWLFVRYPEEDAS